MGSRVLKIHPHDNVLVALQDLPKGESINYKDQVYLLKEDVPAKHKFYIVPLKKRGRGFYVRNIGGESAV